MKGALKNPPEWTAVGSPWPWTSSPTKQNGGVPWWPARTIAERTDPESPAVGAGHNGPTVTAAPIRHIPRGTPSLHHVAGRSTVNDTRLPAGLPASLQQCCRWFRMCR
jgi:hypothetical protein